VSDRGDCAEVAEPLLPIFPLPDVVLFPGERAKLHVFEPRYRKMVADLELRPPSRRRIGTLLFAPEPAPDAPPSVELRLIEHLSAASDRGPEGAIRLLEPGTAARVLTIEPLPGGRSELLLEGEFRFELLRLYGGAPYRQARIAELPEEPFLGTPEERCLVAEQLRAFAAGFEALRGLAAEKDFARLVNGLVAALDLPPLRKQLLLAGDLTLRAREVAEILLRRRKFESTLAPFRRFALRPEWN